jgi:dTDP-glucose 4,6-dehydratase
VEDRPGHDRRYSITCGKLSAIGWTPRHGFDEALEKTIKWYVENERWWRKIKDHQVEYKAFTQKWYERR